MKQAIYLDYAAATPMDTLILDSMMPFFTDAFYNPSANYSPAKNIRLAVDQARKRVANVLGAKSEEIVFTAGGTEANNLVINGIMEQYSGKNLIISAIEHDSVLEASKKYRNKIVPVDEKGIVLLNKLDQLINDDTVLLSIIFASNEVGTIQPIKEIASKIRFIKADRLSRGIKTPIYLHSDASQAPNYLDIHHSSLGVDFMTLNGGKIYGPKQSGILFIKSGINLSPIIVGGGQENNLRSGTENVAGIVGFSFALEKAQLLRKSEYSRILELQKYLIDQLKTQLKDVIFNGSLKKRLPNNIHITIPGVDNERLLILLDIN